MGWKWIRDEKVIARKQHNCLLCGEFVEIGEEYTKRIGTWEDGIMTMKMHNECEEITKEWDEFDWQEREIETFERPRDFNHPQKL